jgi:hypothetical protein
MSKSAGKVLKKEPEEAEPDSVFDFLYHDNRRIASFLSQFDNNGLLTGLTQGEGVTKGAKRSKRFGIGANAPVLGGGNVDFEIGPGETGTETLERVYDPYWANARQFLDVLAERSLLQRDINAASIGQFILITGFLSIQDLSALKEAWKLPSIQRTIKSGVAGGKRQGSMTAAQKNAVREELNNTELFLEFIQILPHSVHARLLSEVNETTSLSWCTLDPSFLVMPASDIMLTYGESMSGEWSIVGILNAYPEFRTPDINQRFDDSDFGLMHSLVGQVAKLISPVARLTMGRPSAAYAITPILIFREVK